jgi:hypothetical protein
MSAIAAGELLDHRLQVWMVTDAGGVITRYQTKSPTDISAWSSWFNFLEDRPRADSARRCSCHKSGWGTPTSPVTRMHPGRCPSQLEQASGSEKDCS